MEAKNRVCPGCDGENDFNLDRRAFLKTVGVTAAAAAGGLPLFATPKVQAAPTRNSPAETAVKVRGDFYTKEQQSRAKRKSLAGRRSLLEHLEGLSHSGQARNAISATRRSSARRAPPAAWTAIP